MSAFIGAFVEVYAADAGRREEGTRPIQPHPSIAVRPPARVLRLRCPLQMIPSFPRERSSSSGRPSVST